MAKLTKEAYEGRKAYAAKRNAENAEKGLDNGLTQEQADVLAQLCKFRHELHTEASDALIHPESCDFGYWMNELDSNGGICMRELVKSAGFDAPFKPFNAERILTNEDWEYVLDTDEQLEYANAEDVEAMESAEGTDEYDELEETALSNAKDNFKLEVASQWSKEVARINSEIQNFLSAIDEKFGTKYAPTGATRI